MFLCRLNGICERILSNTTLKSFDKSLERLSTLKMDLQDVRAKYNTKSNAFLENDIEIKEPIALFTKWLEQIKTDPNIIEPNAMCLSTASKSAVPSARFVLCKGFSPEGFQFFTHYTSRKGKELEENPNAALTFYWPTVNRSVRIEGIVEKLPLVDADAYFNKRPYQSQIGALCSDQSHPIPSRQTLLEKEQELRGKFGEGEVPRPPQWGGYILKHHTVEFWQGQTDRIHDRIKFRRNEGNTEYSHQGVDGWVYERLAP